ncbi:pimeloyl-ACP methyl ester carboxylesterase [Phycicoccus badiiscoriae]|uniref:Pimeloyl-ACP methyl ester carboxylesterase n=1 Tax=Pedococcus badiiscoriae TaxID=642776 RepID=A0A852WGA6_9MICO|nr:alpha/beta hydrolase-fold protein [Pedococcus badiiscoriae]NYG08283.1 pimeloyl-ACP methyl ester carboxylesterase [Pedococcus badiiscoriae]
MEITDVSLLVLLGLVALALFGLVVAGVPRFHNVLAVRAMRAAQVLLLNLVVVALCGAVLNDQYVFYSSWADMFGSRATQVRLHHGGTAHQAIAAQVAGPGLSHVVSLGPLPPLPQPGSRLQTYNVVDHRSDAQGQVLVYLPVGYDPTSSRTYPVVLGLHGFPGGPQSFVRLSFLKSIDSLTAEHRFAPSIVVIPRIDTPSTLDTECVNGAAGQQQTDTWLSQDIPAWTLRHFHVRTDRTSWATVGYSYGAWCAASLALRHPDVFGAAVLLQGYFRPDFSAGYDPLGKASLHAYDLIALARRDPPPVAMWVLTSREDSLSYPTTSKFLSVARPPLDIVATVLAHGGHRAAVFDPHIPDAMAWLGQTLPGFHA